MLHDPTPPTALPPPWQALYEELNGIHTFALRGVRDTQYPCETFDPTTTRPTGDGECMGDGHYLCLECSHLSARSERWPCEPCATCALWSIHDAVSCPTCGGRQVIYTPGWEV